MFTKNPTHRKPINISLYGNPIIIHETEKFLGHYSSLASAAINSPPPDGVLQGRKHCCHSGYTCDPSTGSCSKSRELRWDNWGALFKKRRRLICL
ncbi:hypothetical protein SKAU_G00097450 [Synaphobranchus kaupii]|uniref:Uncharacterized protein n=1 Tax=Synaphobranchus kaupii TaxID=118154 RepID=A0A9Q1FY43_SYNKA|nr:hypothetical protein SKAU_G00097450 [Synaphobranchus kaupii]